MSQPFPPPPDLIPDELRQYVNEINPITKLPRHRVALMLAMMAKTLQQQLTKPQFGLTVNVQTRPDGFTLHADIAETEIVETGDVQFG